MSEIQALCDVTHTVNVISYTVDDMSNKVHVKSSKRACDVINTKGCFLKRWILCHVDAHDGIHMPPVIS